MAKVSDTKAMGEVRALEQFYSILQVEPAKAFYGLKHIQRANEAQAIETLLISDNLFRYVDFGVLELLSLCSLKNWYLHIVLRCQDVKQRKEYVMLVDSVKESGGDVKIFSSLHVTGERKFSYSQISVLH